MVFTAVLPSTTAVRSKVYVPLLNGRAPLILRVPPNDPGELKMNAGDPGDRVKVGPCKHNGVFVTLYMIEKGCASAPTLKMTELGVDASNVRV